jgi:molecular chaperone HtpG
MLEVKLIKRVKLHIIDQGIGMTSDEVEKYINQLVSGAEEFLEKYKDTAKDSESLVLVLVLFCFMVASKVEIIQNHTKMNLLHTGFVMVAQISLEPADKTTRGTEIILHTQRIH